MYCCRSVHAYFSPKVLAIGNRISVHFILGVFFEIIIHAVVDFAYSLKLYLSCLFHSLEQLGWRRKVRGNQRTTTLEADLNLSNFKMHSSLYFFGSWKYCKCDYMYFVVFNSLCSAKRDGLCCELLDCVESVSIYLK